MKVKYIPLFIVGCVMGWGLYAFICDPLAEQRADAYKTCQDVCAEVGTTIETFECFVTDNEYYPEACRCACVNVMGDRQFYNRRDYVPHEQRPFKKFLPSLHEREC